MRRFQNKIRNKKEVWVFDFDDTLIKTNHILDSQFLYFKINDVIYHRIMMDLLLELQKKGKEIFIITARPIELRQRISEICRIPSDHVYCRDFSNSKGEIKKIINSPYLLNKFTKDSIKFKIKILNILAKNTEIVHFYDDFAEKYRKKRIKKRISIKLPILE